MKACLLWLQRILCHPWSLAMVLLMILCLGAKVVCAWNEPTGFRGIPWGATVAQVQKQLPTLTCDTRDPARCRGDLVIAGVSVLTDISFCSTGMHAVSMTFDSGQFFDIKQAFMDRYGKPTTWDSAPTEASLFVWQSYPERLAWKGDTVTIALDKYGTDLQYSYGSISTSGRCQADVERFMREKQAREQHTREKEL
jgi:hypothetical protein